MGPKWLWKLDIAGYAGTALHTQRSGLSLSPANPEEARAGVSVLRAPGWVLVNQCCVWHGAAECGGRTSTDKQDTLSVI